MEQVEAIGLVKMEILAQGGLAVMRDARMIAAGEARGVHHIESPAMCTLERMVNVSNVDDLIAIVSVIRPGSVNNLKKEQFALRAQELEPVDYGTIVSLKPYGAADEYRRQGER